MNLTNLIREAEDFDQVVSIVEDFEKKVQKYSDLVKFLNGIKDLSDEEISNELNSMIDFAEKTGYPIYGYPGISVIDELKKILKKKDIKKALQELIDKLEKVKYGYGYPSVEGKTEGLAETVNLFDQEILAVGDYAGKGQITKEDLERIAKNWAELKDEIKPPIKLGHTDNDTGLPALGWVENVRVEGDKLVADFKDVPKYIADLIRRKAYRRVSAELYIEPYKGKQPPILRAVALLGADIPAIKTLKDLEVLYNSDVGKYAIVYPKDIKNQIGEDMEERIKQIEKDYQQLKEENLRLKIERFMESHKEKILPSFKGLVEGILMQTLDDEKVVKFSEDNQEKEIKIGEAICQLIERLPKLVEFDEKAKTSNMEKSPEDIEFEKIKKYAEEKGLPIDIARKELKEKGEI